jgi:Transcriptional regulator
MDLKYFAYILEIAETKSFTKAAQNLYITQPTLSQFVYSMETELNVKLFDRSSHGVRLTEAGEIFIASAKRILEEYSEMKQRMYDLSAPKTETVVLALSNYRTAFFAPKIISQFQKRFQTNNIILMEKDISESKIAIRSGQVDFTISANLAQADDLGHTKICKEELILAVPANNPCNKKYPLQQGTDDFPEIELCELKDECFILLDKNQPLSSIVSNIFQRASFTPKKVIQCSTMNSANSMVMNDLGCTFLTDLFIYENRQLSKGNRYYRIKRLHPMRDVYLFHRKINTLNKLQKSFISIVQETFA